ncbi:MAG: hypothetical protein J5847_05455 [Clostridia bacterium]|nr:hypothetical protein [Clostridia bacterium]
MKNQYPVVLLHGMFGFGQQEWTENVLPYFGLWNTHIRKMFEAEGIRCVSPSMGPYTSAWNRVCEVYAQLTGGTVDYGKVHSEKYGMERYGRTFEALLPEWGMPDKDGNLVKINLIGHSFGGITSRLLTELLINGSEEERAGTPENELSPLFKGGHENFVHSITTLAAPHNGVTCTENRTGKVMTEICIAICKLFNIVDATPLQRIYDLRLDMYGITTPPSSRKFSYKNQSPAIRKYFCENRDNIIGDLTLRGAKEVNAPVHCHENVYYFSYRGQRTRPVLGGLLQIPGPHSFPILRILGFFMGINFRGMPQKDWLPNDLIINTESGTAPENEPRTDFVSNDACKPGIWHVMPLEVKDHMSYLGWAETKEDFRQFYWDIYNRVSNLPTVDK